MVWSDSADLLTIAEAVELLRREGYDVTTNKLRQYEKQSLISPKKSPTKYRLYSDSDLSGIRKILSLILLGFSIKEIKYFFDLGNKSSEIINRLFEIDNKIKESNKLEKTEETVKHARNHVAIIINKWTTIESNKNCLILSKYLDFYDRILEIIDKRRRMLEILKKISFNDDNRRYLEEILDTIQERTQKKLPL